LMAFWMILIPATSPYDRSEEINFYRLLEA
jgi:hypothetical protein